jgi:hypothetical protein
VAVKLFDKQYADSEELVLSRRAPAVFECIRRGAEDYMLKPVTLKEVKPIWQQVWRCAQSLLLSNLTPHASRPRPLALAEQRSLQSQRCGRSCSPPPCT